MTARERVDEALDGYRGLDPVQLILVPQDLWKAFCADIGQEPDDRGGVTYRDVRVEEAAARTEVTLVR